MTCAEFYGGGAPDHRGRTLEEVQGWGFDRLESVHDFIQWLFPLPDPSPVNPHAPVLTQADIGEFRARAALRTALRKSFEVMLAFYGFALIGGCEPRVERSPDFAVRSANWLTPGNHNHLRITRILSCLRLCGLEAEARAFLWALEEIYVEESRRAHPRITPATWRYWREAAPGLN